MAVGDLFPLPASRTDRTCALDHPLGAKASSHMLRRSARCTECGGKGATIQIPGWGGLRNPIRGWPGTAEV
jgi:hypothetical protein